MEQFRVAMKKTIGTEINDKELDLMFMKVRTNHSLRINSQTPSLYNAVTTLELSS